MHVCDSNAVSPQRSAPRRANIEGKRCTAHMMTGQIEAQSIWGRADLGTIRGQDSLAQKKKGDPQVHVFLLPMQTPS